MRFVLHVFPLPVDVVGGNKGWMGTFCPPEMEGVMMSGDLEHRGRSKLTILSNIVSLHQTAGLETPTASSTCKVRGRIAGCDSIY